MQITDRRLQSHSVSIPCDQIPETTYLEDVNGSLWMISRNGTIRPHNYSQVYIPSFYTAILQLRGINSHILQHVPEPLNEFSLLDVLARSQGTIQELNAMRNSDSDNNIAHSIGRIIGTTLSGLSTGGSHIIRAIRSAMHDGLNGLGDLDAKVVSSLGKAPGNVIKSSGEAIDHVSKSAGSFFHDVLGGLSGSLLWGALILLAVFCAYNYLRHSIFCHISNKDVLDDIHSHDDSISSTFSAEPESCVDCGLSRCPLNLLYPTILLGKHQFRKTSLLLPLFSMFVLRFLACLWHAH